MWGSVGSSRGSGWKSGIEGMRYLGLSGKGLGYRKDVWKEFEHGYSSGRARGEGFKEGDIIGTREGQRIGSMEDGLGQGKVESGCREVGRSWVSFWTG